MSWLTSHFVHKTSLTQPSCTKKCALARKLRVGCEFQKPKICATLLHGSVFFDVTHKICNNLIKLDVKRLTLEALQFSVFSLSCFYQLKGRINLTVSAAVHGPESASCNYKLIHSLHLSLHKSGLVF